MESGELISVDMILEPLQYCRQELLKVNFMTHCLPLGAWRVQVQFAGSQEARHSCQRCCILNRMRARIEHFDLDNIMVRFSRSTICSAMIADNVNRIRRDVQFFGNQGSRL